MFIVKYRAVFYTFSLALVAASIAAISVWGLHFGIDFKGGSSLQFQYQHARPAIETVKNEINSLPFQPSIQNAYSLIPTGDAGYILNLRSITDTERGMLVSMLASNASNTIEVKQFSSIGPVLGAQAARKSMTAIVLVVLCIVLFITFAFRKVSEPVASWKYGMISIVCLIHDMLIPTGAFAILQHFFHGYEIDTLFVTAILVILGFSIHDTIVVFDRVRENLRNNFGVKNAKPFDQVVGASISQTFIRSVNTSLTTLIAVLVVYLVGPAATKAFSLALLVGIFFGTYSSIFIGSNLLVTLEKRQQAK